MATTPHYDAPTKTALFAPLSNTAPPPHHNCKAPSAVDGDAERIIKQHRCPDTICIPGVQTGASGKGRNKTARQVDAANETVLLVCLQSERQGEELNGVRAKCSKVVVQRETHVQ